MSDEIAEAIVEAAGIIARGIGDGAHPLQGETFGGLSDAIRSVGEKIEEAICADHSPDYDKVADALTQFATALDDKLKMLAVILDDIATQMANANELKKKELGAK